MFDDRRTMMGVNEMGVQVTQTEVFAPATSMAVPRDLPLGTLHHPAAEEIELAAVLHALSDPMRLQIVVGLANGDQRPCGSFDLPVTKSTCTHHFKVLREAGVIRQRLEGTTRLNSLRRKELEQRFPGLVDSVLRAAG
jgi:DNA-binding transcriptional ArsR family regulator